MAAAAIHSADSTRLARPSLIIDEAAARRPVTSVSVSASGDGQTSEPKIVQMKAKDTLASISVSASTDGRKP